MNQEWPTQKSKKSEEGKAIDSKIQKFPAWRKFDQLDAEHKRTPPTVENVEFMNRSLHELAEIFNNSGLNWNLDGAMSISLTRGLYIGNHKDIDVSIEEADIEKFSSILQNKHYGLFRIESSDKEVIFHPISSNVLHTADTGELIFAVKVDENGGVVRNLKLPTFDIRVIKRNEKGRQIFKGIELPEKWDNFQTIMHNGDIINTSNPAKCLFFKLRGTRDYDFTDAETLVETGVISEDDFRDIEKMFAIYYEQESQNKEKKITYLAEKIAPLIDAQTSTDDILKIFSDSELLHEHFVENESKYKEVAKLIINSDWTAHAIIDIAKKNFDDQTAYEKIKNKIEKLKSLHKKIKIAPK